MMLLAGDGLPQYLASEYRHISSSRSRPLGGTADSSMLEAGEFVTSATLAGLSFLFDLLVFDVVALPFRGASAAGALRRRKRQRVGQHARTAVVSLKAYSRRSGTTASMKKAVHPAGGGRMRATHVFGPDGVSAVLV